MYKILAVDDEKLICSVLKQFLANSGFEVLTGSCGQEALNIIEKHDPDLLIMDKKMPGMDGLAVLEIIRKNGNMIPVILLTGSYSIQESMSGMNKANPVVLVKPVDLNILLRKVKSLLGDN